MPQVTSVIVPSSVIAASSSAVIDEEADEMDVAALNAATSDIDEDEEETDDETEQWIHHLSLHLQKNPAAAVSVATPVPVVVVPKKRGRPKGTGGPRVKYFIIAAKSEAGDIILEHVEADNLNSAHNIFSKKHGVPVSKSLNGKGNGYYVAYVPKNLKQEEISAIEVSTEKPSITISTDDYMRRTTMYGKGTYQGWSVSFNGVKGVVTGHADNEMVAIRLGEPIIKGTPKPKIGKSDIFKKSVIENAVIIEQ